MRRTESGWYPVAGFDTSSGKSIAEPTDFGTSTFCRLVF